MTRKFAGAAVFAAIVALGSVPFVARADSDGEIKYRKSVMDAIGGHLKAANLILKGGTKHAGDIGVHAAALSHLADVAGGIFPKDSDFGNTGAKMAVWEKPDAFKKAMTDFQHAAHGFDAAVKGPDKKAVAGAFAKLAKTCENCHDEFREKKR